MQRIALEQAAPGMKLARAVTNQAGLAVLAAGVELDQAMIARLCTMDIGGVYVEGCPLEGGAQEKPLAELERELAARFRKASGDPNLDRVHAAVLSHLRLSLAGASAQGGEGAA